MNKQEIEKIIMDCTKSSCSLEGKKLSILDGFELAERLEKALKDKDDYGNTEIQRMEIIEDKYLKGQIKRLEKNARIEIIVNKE